MDSAPSRGGEFGFTVLGSVGVSSGGVERVVSGVMRRGLLAALLLNANRCVTTARLEALLWDHPPCSAVANLRNYVADLRRVVGARLESVQGGYLLRTRPGELDLERFRGNVAAARSSWAAGDGPAALRHYAEARRLSRGGPRSDLPGESSLRRQLEALSEGAVVAAQEEIAIQLELGRSRDAIEGARTVLDEHPTHEGSWRLLMTALYREGDVAGALGAYRSAAHQLRAHLGIDPGMALSSLHGRMLARDPTLEPSRILESPRVPAMPLVRPNQLPHRHLGFVGREAELTRLTELMRAPGRVALVRGPAAVGKTALVVEWATRHEADFPDGVLYVDLGRDRACDGDPHPILVAFVRALGWPREVVGCSMGEVSALYRSLLANRRVLVVLDAVADEDDALALLPGCGPSAVVMTSRSTLRGVRSRVGAAHLSLRPSLQPEEAVSAWDAAGVQRGARPVRMRSTPAPGVTS